MPEDKAVDLYVLERAFTSTHPDSEQLFQRVLDAYSRETGNAWTPIYRRLQEGMCHVAYLHHPDQFTNALISSVARQETKHGWLANVVLLGDQANLYGRERKCTSMSC